MMLRLLSCHLDVFGEMSIQIFCQFFYWIVFLLSCKSSLYTLDAHPYQILDLQIFSTIMQVAFTFAPFTVQSF